MKPNEAPEKIYLEKVYPDNGVLPNGLNYNQSPNDIEYIRTDVVAQRVEDCLYDSLLHGDMECSNIEALIERFKKRIKE